MARVTPDCPAAVHDTQLNKSGGGRAQDARTGSIPPVPSAPPASAFPRRAAGSSAPAHPSRDPRAGADPKFSAAASDLALGAAADQSPPGTRAPSAVPGGSKPPAGPANPRGGSLKPGRSVEGPLRPGQDATLKAYRLAGLPAWPAPPAPGDVLLNVRLNLTPVAASRPRVSPAEYTRIGGQKVKTKKAHGYNVQAYEDYKEKVGWLLKQACGARRNDTGDLGAYGVFHLPAKAGAADGDNLLKAVIDAGNGIAWGDDRQFTDWLARVVRGSGDPHTDLVVYRVPAVAGLAGIRGAGQ